MVLPKIVRIKKPASALVASVLVVSLFFSPSLFADPAVQPDSETLLRDTFYLNQDVKLKREVFEVEGFFLVPQPAPDWNSSFSIITSAKGNIITTHILKNVNSSDDARKFFLENVKLYDSYGVPIRALALETKTGKKKKLYWVGSRAFRSLNDARKSVKVVKKAIEKQGGDFEEAIRRSNEISKVPAVPAEKPPAPRTAQEEEFLLKMVDWLGFDKYLYGPFYGIPSGEPILYQATFETSYRTTNLSERHFDSDVGYFSNRLVFKGLRFLASTTIDPYVEVTPSLESNGLDYASYVQIAGGFEWRPFARSAFLQNFQPYGLPLLDWLRNLRTYVAYVQNKNIKYKFDDPVKTYSLEAGITLFKEWGIDLPTYERFSSEGKFFKKSDLVWGELYGEYIFDKTNYTAGDNLNCMLYTTAFKIGLKFPRFPLPNNPINEEFLVMPYFLFEDTRNGEFSRFYQNRMFYGWGVRWMPFRDYRFVNNEWLFKTKFFFEYIQDVNYTKNEPDGAVPEKDFRLGVNVSLRRF